MFLDPADYDAWKFCHGRPALQDLEEPIVGSHFPEVDLAARKSALEAQGAVVEVTLLVPLDVGVITGERNALAIAGTILIAEFPENSRIEVYGHENLSHLKILTLAALIKYALLHNFTDTGVGSADEVYAFGAEVTEAAAIALSLRADAAALSHLTPGDYCKTCRAAYHCPALKELVHKKVFGEIQAPDEPTLTPLSARAHLEVPTDLPAYIENTLKIVPMVEGWCATIRAHDALLKGIEAPAKVKRKYKKRKKLKSRSSSRDVAIAP
jgi:hypothetical protein